MVRGWFSEMLPRYRERVNALGLYPQLLLGRSKMSVRAGALNPAELSEMVIFIGREGKMRG